MEEEKIGENEIFMEGAPPPKNIYWKIRWWDPEIPSKKIIDITPAEEEIISLMGKRSIPRVGPKLRTPNSSEVFALLPIINDVIFGNFLWWMVGEEAD